MGIALSLPCGRYLLNRNEMELTVLRVSPKRTRLRVSVLYTPADSTLLHSLPAWTELTLKQQLHSCVKETL